MTTVTGSRSYGDVSLTTSTQRACPTRALAKPKRSMRLDEEEEEDDTTKQTKRQVGLDSVYQGNAQLA